MMTQPLPLNLPAISSSQGGITSSDLAVKAMGATRAEVAGQALPGVPLWRLGPGSRYPGMPYIVFPGKYFPRSS
jgi:uncharacterized protein YgbK (DUF1537 family)